MRYSAALKREARAEGESYKQEAAEKRMGDTDNDAADIAREKKRRMAKVGRKRK